MKRSIQIFLSVFLAITSLQVSASDSTGVVLNFTRERLDDSSVVLTIKATIPSQAKLYALETTDNKTLFSSISFDTIYKKYLIGTVEEKGSRLSEKDPSVGATVKYFQDSVLWQQKFHILSSDSVQLKGTINYLYKKGEVYLPAEKEFRIAIGSEKVSGTGARTLLANRSLLWIFLTAFAGGLLALLTPCVYSMIPVTVSFFTKRSKSKSEGIKNALYYSSSIVIIFTFIGFLVTLIFGPAALNNLATNWIANLIFFAVFVIFGISFLGAFEIGLPSAWANIAGSKSGMGSFMGIFFMALTLVVVSFSCTGPIIGNLLVLAAHGSYWGPLTGMLGFSTALALPFALFAFFPSRLNVLAKAGGWLNAVKVTLGFLELALALKFFSNADLSRGWRILDREIFISVWIVLFGLLGCYLLGKLRFRHDDELSKNDFGLPFVSVTRLFLAIAALVFAVYMIPGLWGAPLKGISAFVPPMGTQDFTASSNQSPIDISATKPEEHLHPHKYYDQMKIYEPEVVTRYGMTTYFDYDEALEVARKLKKPLMLDFTGINCVNCRKMEGEVWSDPEAMKRLKEDFVIVSLYVDARNVDLSVNEQYYSNALNKQIETLGDKNADMQVNRYGANTQPYYFFIDGNEKKLVEEGYGYDPGIKKFISLLDAVKTEFKKNEL
ncbi:MAG: protein-disulfide reductase DsbD family protein [Flavisolibacter sp.]